MRSPKLSVAVAVLAFVGTVSAEPPDDAFFRDLREAEMRDPPLTGAARLRLFEECERRTRTPANDRDGFEREYACVPFARRLIAEGSVEDLERLWALAARMARDRMLRVQIVTGFLDERVTQVLGSLHLPKAERPAALPAPERPARRHWADPDLDRASRAYRAISDRYRLFLSAARPEPPVEFQQHEGDFFTIVAAYLRHELSPAETVRRMAEFTWGGWCGTGSDALYEPQSRTILLAALEQQDYALAAAAAAAMGRRDVVADLTRPGREQVLSAAGFDWEDVYVGALLDGDVRFLPLLGRWGGERTAGLLLAVRGDGGKGWSAAGIDDTLAALVTPGGECREDEAEGVMSSDDVTRALDAPPVSERLQDRILFFLGQAPDTGLEDEAHAARRLFRICRRESRPAFRRMLASRYEAVRVLAWKALTALGESVTPPERHPLRFQIRREGLPAAKVFFDVALAYVGGGGRDITTFTDDAGWFELSPDLFVDAGHAVESLRLVVTDDEGAPTFTMRLPVPRSSEPTVVDVPANAFPPAAD